MNDVRHFLGQRKQLACAALGFGTRSERLIHVHGIDPPLPQRVLRNRKTDLDQLDVFRRVNAVLLQKHREWSVGATTDHRNADGLVLEIGNGLDRRIVLNRPIDREAAGLFEDVLCHDVGLQISADHAVRQR